MATVKCLLVLCVLAGTPCLAQLDSQSLGAVIYTDSGVDNGLLTVSNVTVYPSSPQPTDQVYLLFNVTNPTSENVTLSFLYWVLGFPIYYCATLSNYDLVVPARGTIGPVWVSNSTSLNQIYSSGWIPFQIFLCSNDSMLANRTGSVYIEAPPNQSNCSYEYSQLNLSSVDLHTNMYNQSFYLTFKVENEQYTNVSFTEVFWQITFNSAAPIWNDQTFSPSVTVGKWGSRNLTSVSIPLSQNLSISWYEYYFQFYNNGYFVACWQGYQVVHPSPPNPPVCFNGNSLLGVKNVVLHHSSPQIHDSIYLTFDVDNWSGVNVTFNHIYSILTFNSSSPIVYNLTLSDLTLRAGQNISLVGNQVTLNQSFSAGTYPYQFVFYSNSTTEVGCWGGNITIRDKGDCLDGPSQLKVTDVILSPNSPQIYDPVSFLITIENESGRNVAFNGIYWTLTFTPGKSLSHNQTLGSNVILVSGTSLTLNGKSFTLTESISAGTYSYQIEIYEDATKIACWGGDIVVPSLSWSSLLETSSSSSYIYFLGLAGLSILFTS